MFRYIIRRIFQMIPTVFGVIVITFILFNIVGGSPAAMTLVKMFRPRRWRNMTNSAASISRC